MKRRTTAPRIRRFHRQQCLKKRVINESLGSLETWLDLASDSDLEVSS